MCFGGGSIAPVKIDYEKPDFGPLPSLKIGEKVNRKVRYGQYQTGQQVRSLLMPLGIENE
jgi:hypothetical protein